MIQFALPGLYEHFTVNQALVLMKETTPEIFRNNVDIGCFYGNFQFCIWDGGRVFSNYKQASIEQVQFVRDFFNSKNIPIRLIYTNPVLQEKHLYERFPNLVTGFCENELNEIVVNSDMLEQFLREKYPQYNFISSTTKCLNTPAASSEEFNKNYKYICLDYNLNKNDKFLSELSQSHADKIELLVNAICPPGCQSRKSHYDANGLSSLNYNQRYGVNCYIDKGNLHPNVFNYKNNLSPEECLEYEKKYGIKYFKLEGRTFSKMQLILNYARYLAKPEYVYVFIQTLYETSETLEEHFNSLNYLH